MTRIFAVLFLLISIWACNGSTSDISNPSTPVEPSGPSEAPSQPPQEAPIPPQEAPPQQAKGPFLVWDMDSTEGIAGYIIYYGLKLPEFSPTQSLIVETMRFDLSTLVLVPGTYHFAVTAFDDHGNESAFSNIVEWLHE